MSEFSMAGMAAEAGMDVTLCELCEEPLKDAPYKRGLDGAGAHLGCLPRRWLNDDNKKKLDDWRKAQGVKP